jgi:hypothetical protein
MGWYRQKAGQCGKMARKATDPQMRKAYEEQQKRWLEIAEALERHEQRRARSINSDAVSARRKDDD